MITKNVRTHFILLVDWSRINITQAQAEFYQQEVELKKYNEFISITDIDTNEILFNWRCNEIKRFEKRKQTNNSWYNFVCDFWNRHPISMKWLCNCQKEFWVMGFQFHDWLRDNWYNFVYTCDITEEMRQEFKNRKIK